MKATELKCPKCGTTPSRTAYTFELVEPAMAYRKLAVGFDAEGTITSIESADVSHDDGDGEKELGCRSCGTLFPIPKGFWKFDIYG